MLCVYVKSYKKFHWEPPPRLTDALCPLGKKLVRPISAAKNF